MTAFLNELFARIRAMFRAGTLDRDLEDEYQSHQAMFIEEQIRRGVAPEEAQRLARLKMGGLAQLREAHREIRGVPLLDELRLDLRYALRAARRNAGFTALAVLTLAIGIGVNTAAFTVYNGWALRPIQARDPARLVQVSRVTRDPFFSYPDYVYYRDHSRSFTELALMGSSVLSMNGAPETGAPNNTGLLAMAGLQFPHHLQGSSEPVNGIVVSGNYFQFLGAGAVRGRTFLADEDSLGAQPVILMSENFWQRRFGGDPGILGRNLRLNGIDAAVIGITPRDFTGTYPLVPDVWIPAALHYRFDASPAGLLNRKAADFRLYGSLRDGVTWKQAEAEMDALGAQLQAAFPAKADGEPDSQSGRLIVGEATRGSQPGGSATAPAMFLLAAVGMVLLIACANVASLLLARSATRRREIAARLSLGASRGRLVRQLLTENAVVSAMAGALGVLFSWWWLRFLVEQIAATPIPNLGVVALNIAPDWRILAYVAGLAVMATIGFGLAPALQASSPDLSLGLKDQAAAFGPSVRKSRLRNLMLGTQVAVCLLLLIGTGLLARSSVRALDVDLGFDYHNVVSLAVVFPPSTSADRIASVRTQMAGQLERLPEIQSVALASHLPLAHCCLHVTTVTMDGRPSEAVATLVTPNYFSTMGIPIVRGRGFTAQEARDSSVVIVSETTARRFWSDENPIGKRLASSIVVGVAKDVRSLRLDRVDSTCLYYPVTPAYGGAGTSGRPEAVIIVKARTNAAAAVSSIERELRASHHDLEIAVSDSRTAFSSQTAFVAARIGAVASAFIGILGLLMAAAGIHGTVGFAVAQRTQEIGIRMALGARGRNVLALVLAETMRPVVMGLAAGFSLAAIASLTLSRFLFGLSKLDPLSFAGAVAFLAAVALLAIYVPARRATKVDPMVALRYE